MTNIQPTLCDFYIKVLMKPEADAKMRVTEKFRVAGGINSHDAAVPAVFKFPLTFDETLDRHVIIQMIETTKMGMRRCLLCTSCMVLILSAQRSVHVCVREYSAALLAANKRK